MDSTKKASRLKRELESLTTNPPPGISCVQKEDSLDVLDASKFNIVSSNEVRLESKFGDNH
jgi:ubiquitin-protein ligase